MLIDISYINRHEEELTKLKHERRPGRPPTSRQERIELQMSKDNHEYDSGFWIPNMEDEKNLDALRQWDGQWQSLGSLNFVRLSRSGLKHASSFPVKRSS